MPSKADIRRTLDVLVRRERGRLIAALVARIGVARIDLAEDVAQEALEAAMNAWPYKGLPDSPAAWLTRVAWNKAMDRLRREVRHTEYVERDDMRANSDAPDPQPGRVDDPELRLLFLCCQSGLSQKDQLALTLRVSGGFTAAEIAQVFLENKAAVGQRIARAKRGLRLEGEAIAEPLSIFDIRSRLETVLKVIYLMFCIGYAPRAGGELIRRHVAEEAIRLACLLADQKLVSTGEAQALAALVCFQGSRLDARTGQDGNLVLLRDQDRSKWDRASIAKGMIYLQASRETNQLTQFHIEAGIAAAHATSMSWASCDWQVIVELFDALEALSASPVVTINSAVASAMNGAHDVALSKLDKLSDHQSVQRYAPLYVARAEVLSLMGRRDEAAENYRRAIACGLSGPADRHIQQRLALCF